MGQLVSTSKQKPLPRSLDSKQNAFTLLELIVVIGIVAFLSNVVIRQISTGLEQKNLDATVENVAVYFSNASRLARASGQWVYVVVNADPDTQGYLRQMGTYEWFEGVEPGEENNFMDINGNGRHDRQSNSSRVQEPVRGWTVLDPKGFWLPNKIYFDLSRSGPAKYESGERRYRTFESPDVERKYLYFAMAHQNAANSSDDPDDAIDRGRLPFFLDRSSSANSARGDNQILNSANNSSSQDVIGVDPELSSELKFSNTKKESRWLFFPFDRFGRYVNIKSGEVLGTGAPAEAQKDFIVLSQGYIDPANLKQIHGLNDEDPVHSAFLLHRNGSFTKSQDDSQIPSIN